jgi:hypothetical protein
MTSTLENPGYSSESLQMLQTPEGQSNAVFACFGSAAQHAQLFEQALKRFLIVYNHVLTPGNLSPGELEELEDKLQRLQRQTMGTLLKGLKKHISFDEEAVLRRLDSALQERNRLMHSFFLEHGEDLATERGRIDLLKNLVAIEQKLDRARITVNAMRIAMCEHLVMVDPFESASVYEKKTLTRADVNTCPQEADRVEPFTIRTAEDDDFDATVVSPAPSASS